MLSGYSLSWAGIMKRNIGKKLFLDLMITIKIKKLIHKGF